MGNPGLPTSPWSALDRELWHATDDVGFKGIVNDREIRVPRQKCINALCAMFDGVSLLDFRGTATHLSRQFEHWRGWFGDQQESPVAVWLEIDRRAMAQTLLDAGAARALGSDDPARQFIPGGVPTPLGGTRSAIAFTMAVPSSRPGSVEQHRASRTGGLGCAG